MILLENKIIYFINNQPESILSDILLFQSKISQFYAIFFQSFKKCEFK